jgi:galactokinase
MVLDETLQGRVCGAEMLIASDVPVGAGLSSSAALEVACATALVDLSGASMDPAALARVCQRAEHDFAGTQCGIMDQMSACHAREGHALVLDTRTLACTFVPLPAAVRVLICNTMVRHELASGEYNRRRADCDAGVVALRRTLPSIAALRDATLEQLTAVRADLSARVYARCHHVITENERVGSAAAALARGELAEFGALMAASHASLRDDYEVSCPELDVMAGIVSELDGVFGARMTGGGFGGCVVALVEASSATDPVRQTIAERYEASTGRRPEVWVARAGEGVSAWSPARV